MAVVLVEQVVVVVVDEDHLNMSIVCSCHRAVDERPLHMDFPLVGTSWLIEVIAVVSSMLAWVTKQPWVAW